MCLVSLKLQVASCVLCLYMIMCQPVSKPVITDMDVRRKTSYQKLVREKYVHVRHRRFKHQDRANDSEHVCAMFYD
jgi:hypothetical protein